MRNAFGLLLFFVVFCTSLTLFASNKKEYYTYRSKLIMKLDTNNVDFLDELIITSSRIKEKIFNSSVTVEKLNSIEINFQPTVSFFDGVDNMKGVQMVTAGMGFRIINTRGFNSTTNSRFLQLIDGVDNQTPGLQYSIGNIAGVSELDVEGVEIVPGVSSSIYGLNALNGTLQVLTKNPFKYNGLSVYQRTGINHIDYKDNTPSINTETAFRYASSFNDKLAFKINITYMQAVDWKASNQTDVIDPGSPYFETLTLESFRKQNPYYLGSNKVNSYGDELSIVLRLKDDKESSMYKYYTVYRTGYEEKYLVTYEVKNYKCDMALHYKLIPGTELYTTYRAGYGNVIFQRGNRFQLDNYGLHQGVLGLKGRNFSWKFYATIEDSENGNSSNLRVLGENLERRYSNNNVNGNWANDFKQSFETWIDAGLTVEQADFKARAYADRHRAAPMSMSLKDSIKKITTINDWTGVGKGARFLSFGKLYHTEGQYFFDKWENLFILNVGFDARLYSIKPDGNNFQDINGKGENIFMHKLGFFAHIKKQFFNDKLILETSLRGDKNQYFRFFFNPRISGIYNLSHRQNIRFSYQNGYRYPTMWESFAFLNNGGVIRTGGIYQHTAHYNIYDNSFDGATVLEFIKKVKSEINKGEDKNVAIKNNFTILKSNDRKYIKPEYINAFELGYRRLISNKFFIDIEYYFNISSDFIGNLDVIQVLNGTVSNKIEDSNNAFNLASILYNKNGKSSGNYVSSGRQDTIQRYKIHTNSLGNVYSNGFSVLLKYYFNRAIFSMSYTYSDLFKQNKKDVLVLGFNTPRNSVKASVIYPEFLHKNLSFSMSYRFNQSYLWESFFVTSMVDVNHIVDAQFSYKIEPIKTILKLGGTDIFNYRYNQVAAGPTIGANYYLSLSIDLL